MPNQSKFRLSRIYCSVCRIWLTAFARNTEVEFYGYFRNQQNETDVVSDHIRSSVIFAVLNINCQLKKFLFLVTVAILNWCRSSRRGEGCTIEIYNPRTIPAKFGSEVSEKNTKMCSYQNTPKLRNRYKTSEKHGLYV